MLVLPFDGRAQLRPSTVAPTPAAGSPGTGWVAGLVGDVAYLSRGLALGARDQGLGLGHSDFIAQGPLGRHLSGQLVGAGHTQDGRLELELEGAWLQTRTLPAGLQLRAGRFASQVGYLNEQHPHADDFTERPLLYRAFLGNHWIDDGVRINWTAPTARYVRLGAELFRGRGLVSEGGSASAPGAIALSAKVGDDIGLSQSWQAGVSWVRNRREPTADIHGEPTDAGLEAGLDVDAGVDGEVGHDHDRGHSHAAAYTGRNLYLVDLAWKWAPQGNNRQEQVRVVAEYARLAKPTPMVAGADDHEAWSLGIVWRFLPDWEVGARTDRLKVSIPHDDHAHPGRLREHALMLAYKPSHLQTLRLQFTTQRDAIGFDGTARRAAMLQYIVSFGAHSAHSY